MNLQVGDACVKTLAALASHGNDPTVLKVAGVLWSVPVAHLPCCHALLLGLLGGQTNDHLQQKVHHPCALSEKQRILHAPGATNGVVSGALGYEVGAHSCLTRRLRTHKDGQMKMPMWQSSYELSWEGAPDSFHCFVERALGQWLLSASTLLQHRRDCLWAT